MANLIKWGAYPAPTTYLGAGLNALADGANALGAAIDNTALGTHNMYLDAELTRINALSKQICKPIDLLHEYRTALITAAVTGKVKVA